MKGLAFIAAAVLVAMIGFWLFRSQDSIEYHKQQWRVAAEESMGARRNWSGWKWLKHEVSRRFHGPLDYDQVMRRHERDLFRLGYLTTHDFLVTNQVLTREFGSNFFLRIQNTFGTNGQAVWSYRTSTNLDAIHATLPARDVSEWDRIFHECAGRYASNVPNPSLP